MIYIEEQAPVLEIFQERPGHFRLSTALPMRDSTLERGEQRRLAGRMLKVCESLIPDLEYNIKKIIPDLRDPERTEWTDLPALYPFLELKKIPSQILTFGSGTQPPPLSPLAGVWITHEEVSPKDGTWGSFRGREVRSKGI